MIYRKYTKNKYLFYNKQIKILKMFTNLLLYNYTIIQLFNNTIIQLYNYTSYTIIL